ncbi:glycoside hydrolase family 79 protein [Pluteus cervinus]|uniref:Glycoside hydrolase family 79 protein n=1 Tax=Pluteus cervinus TaxID=181527 RepID=A0ACD3ATC0_9AGAR|nr:glycoside hydrolase family 79 protein [Pluteus cervinus]
MLPSSLWGLMALAGSAYADITVYSQVPLGQAQTTTPSVSDAASPTQTPPAYNDTILIPPAPLNPPVGNFNLTPKYNAADVVGLSRTQSADFFGFSIEMSVINQLIGRNSTHFFPPFLNFVGNIVERAGRIRIRLGGNTQEFAALVDSLPGGHAVAKAVGAAAQNPTLTPSILFTRDLFYMCNNISNLVNVEWYFGIPFNTTDWRLEIAEESQRILGDRLGGLQAGNEPDLYEAHYHRTAPYTPQNYHDEVGSLISTIASDDNVPQKSVLIAPNLQGTWTPEQVWDTNFIQDFNNSIKILAVEHYPNNNCYFTVGVGQPQYPQDVFSTFLTHTAVVGLVQPYINSATIAQQYGKPFMMFETNTASCGGFAGVSNSFAATLWALDYGLQMAYTNFTGALLHFGGQNVFYNAFTPPPTNQSSFNQWTPGTIYYAALVIPEALGTSNTSQVMDLGGNEFTPQYSIYENGVLVRMALFNYISDPSGANNYVATITPDGGQVPAQVRVKYLLSDSVATKNNITWAGQTLGTKFQADGRLKGTMSTVTINCDQTANSCSIPVPAPGFALVFFTDSPPLEMEDSAITFATTAYTKTVNTAFLDPSLLATSNGMSGKTRKLGSTSKGSSSGSLSSRLYAPGLVVLVAGVAGGWLVRRAIRC